MQGCPGASAKAARNVAPRASPPRPAAVGPRRRQRALLPGPAFEFLGARYWSPAAAGRARGAMALLGLLLALLSVCLVSALGSQRTFLQVTVPQRIPSYVTGNTERMTFDIDINGKPYIIHLKQQSFLTNDFRVYTYSHGGSAVSFVPPIQRNCYYQGYIEGYTDSIVMLSTCLGLSGLLQFENSSYGIEPVESASGFQHLVYQIEYEDAERPLSEQNYSIRWSSGITPRVESGIPVNFSTTRYVEMHIVVAKGLVGLFEGLPVAPPPLRYITSSFHYKVFRSMFFLHIQT
uniref:disintegrin and metalloproteinase domain-containing protein 2-like n=1 Tax=Podarcis muralis TaxID=64176 RepID=UPI00109F6EFC|nr:disintegrin and metalloproteinase domain-containing protein 2-like [Podarcis muralis]